MSRKSNTAAAFLAIVAPALVLIAYTAATGRYLCSYWDNKEYFEPTVREMEQRLISGDLPFWSHYERLGEAVHAEGQTGVLYPPNIAGHAIVRLLHLPQEALLDTVTALQAILACAGLFALLRRFGVRDSLAATATLSGVLSGYVLYMTSTWYFVLSMFTCLVWALWGTTAVLEDARPARGFVATLLAMASAFYVGYPQMAVYVWLATGLFAVAMSLAHGAPPLRFSAWCGTALAAALCAMPVVWPNLCMKPMSVREGLLPLDIFLSRGISPRAVIGFLMPVYRGSDGFIEWHVVCTTFLGAWLVPALACAALSFAFCRGTRDNTAARARMDFMLCLSLGIFFALMSLGANGGIYRLTYGLPVWSSFRWPFKLFVAAIPFFIVAGGIALEHIADRARRHRFQPLLVFLVATVAVLLWAWRWTPLHGIASWTGLASLVSMLALLGLDRPGSRALLHGATLAVTIGLLGVVHHPDRIRQYRHERLGTFGAESLGIDPAYRVIPLSSAPSDDGFMQALALYRSPTANHYSSISGNAAGMMPSDYHRWFPVHTDGVLPRDLREAILASHLLRACNGKYVVVSRSDADGTELLRSHSEYELVKATPEAFVFANRDALPRVFFATEVRPFTLDAARRGLMLNETPPTCAFVDGETEARTFAGGNVASARWENDEVRVRIAAAADGFLVISMNHFPEWRATIDGHRAELHRVNGLITGLFVPRGAQDIVLTYHPTRFHQGLGAAAAGVLLAGLVATLGLKPREADDRPTSALHARQ